MPIPGIAVTVLDAASDAMLAEGKTDSAGLVRFRDMPPAEIRVRLTGALPGGTALRHTRQDQRGIWVSLPARDWVMDLRVDTDGLVFPDLGLGNAGAPDADAATAIAVDALRPIYPTAPVASVVPTTLPRLSMDRTLTPAPGTDASETAPVPTTHGPGMALLVVLLGTIAGVLWLVTRGRI